MNTLLKVAEEAKQKSFYQRHKKKILGAGLATAAVGGGLVAKKKFGKKTPNPVESKKRSPQDYGYGGGPVVTWRDGKSLRKDINERVSHTGSLGLSQDVVASMGPDLARRMRASH